MGLPRTYKVCLPVLIVKHSFRRDRSGSAAQLAGYWEVFSPGPLTRGAARLAEPEGALSPLILTLRPGSAAPQATGTALPCASGAVLDPGRCQCPAAKDLKLALRVAASASESRPCEPAQVPRCRRPRTSSRVEAQDSESTRSAQDSTRSGDSSLAAPQAAHGCNASHFTGHAWRLGGPGRALAAAEDDVQQRGVCDSL